MAAHKIIFVSQEITPYLAGTENGRWGRSLPQSIQSHKYEVRTFMPDYGDINERRNQLHEVIRLSGMNIPITDNDHPLVVKVASMQPSRIQVYFIDNDDYFQKDDNDVDPFGSNRSDNDERLIFFTRGTVETARKLRWEPQVMQLSGWMSALMPLYIRRVFADGPAFENAKIVYTVIPSANPVEGINPHFFDLLVEDGVNRDDLTQFAGMPLDRKLLDKMAITYADAVVFHDEPDPELTEYCEGIGREWHHFESEGDHGDDYDALYKSLMNK